MFAICIEASHSKGMGHLFRMLNFSKYLKTLGKNFIFFINDNNKTKEILKSKNISFEIVDVADADTNWEARLIEKHNVKYWIDDRLATDLKHAKSVKSKNISLVTFDDLGPGSKYSDINICGLFFNKKNLSGNIILKGADFLILNDEIDVYKKERDKINSILVSLGGSDTYGVTIRVLKLLKIHNIKATIHIGPSFEHIEELEKELTGDYEVITFIPSLIEEFSKYDLAITGGGITPFEANASGLPCLIIANELFEVQNGEFLDKNRSSKFIGYYENIDEDIFASLNDLDIKTMSRNGLKTLNTKAVERIYKEICRL